MDHTLSALHGRGNRMLDGFMNSAESGKRTGANRNWSAAVRSVQPCTTNGQPKVRTVAMKSTGGAGCNGDVMVWPCRCCTCARHKRWWWAWVRPCVVLMVGVCVSVAHCVRVWRGGREHVSTDEQMIRKCAELLCFRALDAS